MFICPELDNTNRLVELLYAVSIINVLYFSFKIIHDFLGELVDSI